MPGFLVWYLYSLYKQCIFHLLKKALSCKESWFWLFYFILFQELLQALSLFLAECYCQQSGKQAQAWEIVLKYGARRGEGRTGIAFSLWIWSEIHLSLELKRKNSYCEFAMYQHWDLHSMSSLTEPGSWLSKQNWFHLPFLNEVEW